MAILQVEQVKKTFGSKSVLQDLSFSVPEGSIFGFVGRNGAGKTTTMKLILGLEELDAGEITVFGEKVIFGQDKTNRQIGYLPDVPAFYDFMTPREYLTLCGEITGLTKDECPKRVTEILHLVNLADHKTRISGFSRGMRQRLGIAQALLNRPKLLICDEPTSALDPNGRREFLNLLYSLRHETTILFSTHILNDVEQICDQIGILDQGKMLITSSLAELKKAYGNQQISIEFADSADKKRFLAAYQQASVKGQTSLTEKNLTLVMTAKREAAAAEAIFRLLSQEQILPIAFEQREPTLEEIFLEVIR